MALSDTESGYIGETEGSCYIGNSMTDVEVIRVTTVNVIARGRRYGRQWLLKGLREELRDSTAMRRQLMKEFEIHSRLLNPAVAQAVGLEHIEGLGTCIVEEWIEGKTLSELIREGSLTKADRRRLMRGVIGAVAYLHGKGIVHRDLKPANIMVRDAGGEAVLIDFGLADTDDYVELKQAAGTPGFISPEQMQSGGAHTSDDVYSLGVIMLELCPEYASIGRKCTGPDERRPKDAGALLKALDSRDRRPRTIAVSIITSLIVMAGVMGAMRIASLSDASMEAEMKVAELTDSLDIVSGRMKEAQAKLDKVEEYNRNVDNVYREAHRQIDGRLAGYDRNVFSKFTLEENKDYTSAWQRMNNEMLRFAESFSHSAAAAPLTAAEREKLRLDMIQYYTINVSKYQDKWTKRIFPTFQPAF